MVMGTQRRSFPALAVSRDSIYTSCNFIGTQSYQHSFSQGFAEVDV
jgi:hypothetical protein